ncbi:uncharacterized protein TNCV_868311 [Trichonephila clavipes]|nr:uncharacterized protein TNCV_868311 [Trichonephila clavipes]
MFTDESRFALKPDDKRIWIWRKQGTRNQPQNITEHHAFRGGSIMGLASNPGEEMDVCNCMVHLRHGGILNSRQAASPLVRLVEGEERCEASDHPQSVLPLNWSGTESNRTVTCMVLKTTANNRRHLALCHDEFRGPRSGLC